LFFMLSSSIYRLRSSFNAGRRSVALVVVLTVAASLSGLMPGPVGPEVARAGPAVVRPKIDCEALAAQDFAAVPDAPTQVLAAAPDAPTQVLAAAVGPADGATPEHCLVTGYVAPQIRFELRLPTQTWTQRYPDDFDGILAGAPAGAITGLMAVTLAWNARANTAADGSTILTPDSLPLLQQAALAECDGRDGLVDGQIDDPRACQFDPGSLQCPPGQAGTDCLTPAQVETARKIYFGPVDEYGERLYPGGLPIGSELEWRVWLFGFPPGGPTLGYSPGDPGVAEYYARSYLRHLATWDEPLSYDELRFDRATFDRLARMSPIYDATDPDLRPFRDNGGKLILWHGWSDGAVPPLGTIAYYQAVRDAVGGLEATRQFARLDLFPGAGHCGGGQGPAEADLLTPLRAWVEGGVAPDGLIARQEQDGQVVRTRPIFPYPAVARYVDSGSVDDAASFIAVPPPRLPTTTSHGSASTARGIRNGVPGGERAWSASAADPIGPRRRRPDHHRDDPGWTARVDAALGPCLCRESAEGDHNNGGRIRRIDGGKAEYACGRWHDVASDARRHCR
jgi:hypothetical protein